MHSRCSMSGPVPIPARSKNAGSSSSTPECRRRCTGSSAESTPERHRKYGSSEKVDMEALMKMFTEDKIKLSLEDIEPKFDDTMGVQNKITILHFNDVYNIEPRDVEPVGGAARQTMLIKSLSHLNPLVLFSGDALNPSLMSTITRGQQMIPVLNSMDVKCAVFGNHDFDFGVEELTTVANETTFPWLMSNCYDRETNKPLANGLTKYMINWEGHKIGLVGLVEEEWIATLAAIDKEDVTFYDYVKEGHKLARELRDEGADIVIALTHMRWPNDRKLAMNCPEIDMILGGHDHDYHVEKVNDRWIIKSGTDFQNMTRVTVTFNPGEKPEVELEKLDVTSSIEEDADIKLIVDKYMNLMSEKMDTVLGSFDVELEGRFSKIRTQETNLGNFICDIMCAASSADLAILNSGTLRSDRIHPRGEFRIKDLTAILPMLDPCVVIRVTGQQVLEALENGVSQYPAHEGRFPQVAGVSFGFDPMMTSGHRIDRKHVHIRGEPLDLEKSYKLCTKSYLALGKDGYDCLKDSELLVDDEEGPLLSTIVQNHFDSVRVVQGIPTRHSRCRRDSIQLARRHSFTTTTSMSSPGSCDIESPVIPSRAMLLKQASVHEAPSTNPDGSSCAHLSPEFEGRIYIIHGERKDDLIAHTLQLEAAMQGATILEATDSEERDEGIEGGGSRVVENQVK
ncbi:mannosylglucosyl-3-phosphoglycerate phosphatase-like isoform X2 [Lineus longissimus]|uniref:mannosylglucosyl-3-phosphoglycerate phosphatase-like isoform X2 n=1 Tax=Lineus longissimus TaxID=88925 RepID=UPI002B4EF664